MEQNTIKYSVRGTTTAKLSPLAHYTPNFECDKFRMILHMNRPHKTERVQRDHHSMQQFCQRLILVLLLLCIGATGYADQKKLLIERGKAVT